MNKKIYSSSLIIIMVGFMSFKATAQAEDDSVKHTEISRLSYGSKGFQLESADERFLLQIQSRLQFRFATPGDQNPLTFDDFEDDNKRLYKINRARLKVGGHAYFPWLKYYWEYELSQSNLLDFRVMVEKWEFLNFKVGQWKTYYNRERVISSGQQQMVDRSILTRPFTIDRQQGIEIYGRLNPGTPYDFNYHISLLTGTGRGAVSNDNNRLMYVGRLQWNMFGRELDMSGSDVFYHEEPHAIVALAGATNVSPYTRFSQSGGGSLEGFVAGENGQYQVNQWVFETALMWKGFSWQQEYHRKMINDNINNSQTILAGNYMQAGYFFSNVWEWFPRPLEVAARYAFFRPDLALPANLQEEYGLAINWFFVEHRNKLSAEISYFAFQDADLNFEDGSRFRLQWDISL